MKNLSPGRSANRRIRLFGQASALTLTASLGLPFMASAQEITDERTDPILSSTINSGAPGDVTITDTGSVVVGPLDGVTAVTMDTDNAFDNQGAITVNDSDNSTGVQILTDLTGDISLGGSVSVVEDYTREDDDEDGDLDGPLAIGTNRVGIGIGDGGTHTGDLTTLDGSSIVVEGNQSIGIEALSFIDGSMRIDGSVGVVGDDAKAIVLEDGASGDIVLGGGITATGENAVAVEITGDIGGALAVESSIQSTGFTSTGLTNYVAFGQTDEDTPALEDRLDDEALLPNTAGMILSGSVTDGLLVNGRVDRFTSQEDIDDETKDTVDDFDENRSTGSITSTGPGPALLITPGAGAGDLTLGTVTETVRDTLDDDEDEDTTEVLATFDYDFGLINRGSIIADGQNVGFDAQAVRIEGNTGTAQETIISGGIQNTGTMRATGFEGNATALSLGAGTQITRLQNEGTIDAATNTTDGDSAIAVDIETGASISTITNSGNIIATTVGESGSATAILDRDGQLSSITNTGTIGAALTSTSQTVTTPGEVIALDLRAHSAGEDVTYLQQLATPVDDTNFDDVIDDEDVTAPQLIGDVLFGAGNETFDVLAGTVDGDIDFGTGDVDFTLDSASLTGEVDFATGTHALDFDTATFNGTLNFTDSTAAVSLIDDSSFTGSIASTNSAVDLSVVDSRLRLDTGTQSDLTSLDVSGTSELVFDIDPFNETLSYLNVAGTAQIGEGVTVTPILQGFSDETFTQTLITADTIGFAGQLSDVGLTDIPHIYNATLSVVDGAESELTLAFAIKTTEELGFDPNQSAAFASLLDVFAADTDLGAEIASITTETEFDQTYNLLLPQRTNASTQYLFSQTNAAFGALADRLDILAFSESQSRGIWVQEHFAVVDQDGDATGPGYNGDGLGFSIGADRRFAGLDNVGLMFTYSSGSFEESTGGNNPVRTAQLGFGGYIQEQVGPVTVRAVGQIGSVDFSSDREVTVGDLFYDIKGDWSGTSEAASLSASTQMQTGFFYVRPQVSVDWFSLSQDAYTETGGDGLLEAEIGAADTGRTSASALVTLGRGFDFGIGILNVEATGGYQSIFSSDPFETTVRYLGSDEAFTLIAPEDADGAALLGVSISSDGQFVKARFGYDLESSDLGSTHYVGASLRLAF